MEQRKKNGSPYRITLVLSLILLLFSCTPKEIKNLFSGDHSTNSIRGMWHICYVSMKKTNPYGPDAYHWQVCDCIVDESRKTFKYEDYASIPSEELTQFFTDSTQKCSLFLKNGGNLNNKTEIPQMRTM